MIRNTTLILALMGALLLRAQINEFETESIQIADRGVIALSMDTSPDGEELAVSTLNGKILFFSPADFSKTREFDVPGFTHGARLNYSADGQFIVLKKIRLQDWNVNKDNKQRIVVIDAKSGEKVLDHDGVYDLALSPDGLTYAIMDKGHLRIRSIQKKKDLVELFDDRLQSSIAFGPQGKLLYASRGFDKKDLKKDPRFKKDRKGRKAYSKFQQTVVGYSVADASEQFISPDNMDEIYDLRCSRRGDCLLVCAKQDAKVNAKLNTNFILQMDLSSGVLLREQFNSRLADPFYKENLVKDIIAVTTNEDMDRSESVMLYDRSTNEIIARFDIDARFLEGVFKGKVLDGKACFGFSADGHYLLIGIGNMLYKWKIKRQD